MWELIIILVIVLLLFGAKRLPELAKGMGQSIRAFKKGMNEAQLEDKQQNATSVGSVDKEQITEKLS